MDKTTRRSPTRATIGERLAPARFLIFGLLFCATAALTGLLGLGARYALLLGFDIAAFVFLFTAIPLLQVNAEAIRRSAMLNDANRVASPSGEGGGEGSDRYGKYPFLRKIIGVLLYGPTIPASRALSV